MSDTHLAGFMPEEIVVEELCRRLYGYDVTYLDGTNNWEWGNWPNMDERAIEYNANTIKSSVARVKETTGLDITMVRMLGPRLRSYTAYYVDKVYHLTEGPSPVQPYDIIELARLDDERLL